MQFVKQKMPAYSFNYKSEITSRTVSPGPGFYQEQEFMGKSFQYSSRPGKPRKK